MLKAIEWWLSDDTTMRLHTALTAWYLLAWYWTMQITPDKPNE